MASWISRRLSFSIGSRIVCRRHDVAKHFGDGQVSGQECASGCRHELVCIEEPTRKWPLGSLHARRKNVVAGT
jgi:hypothetical protein